LARLRPGRVLVQRGSSHGFVPAGAVTTDKPMLLLVLVSRDTSALQGCSWQNGRCLWALSQTKTSGSWFLPCRMRLTNTSRPPEGVARLSTHVCETLASYAPGSHREAHEQADLQMRELSWGEGWACGAATCKGRLQPKKWKKALPGYLAEV